MMVGVGGVEMFMIPSQHNYCTSNENNTLLSFDACPNECHVLLLFFDKEYQLIFTNAIFILNKDNEFLKLHQTTQGVKQKFY